MLNNSLQSCIIYWSMSQKMCTYATTIRKLSTSSIIPKICGKRHVYTGENMPREARVVIAGAGVVANSVAYHLVKNGWNDVLVLEQETISSGTSRFGSGTLGLFKPIAHRNIILYSIKLYNELAEMGYDIGFKKCGSLNLAQTKDRLIALKRRIAYNQPTGLHCELLNTRELEKLHPFLNVEDLKGAVWVPDDCVADPKAICDTLATLAQNGGVSYMEHCMVNEVLTENGRVKGVKTDRGDIECEYFVNCAGMWARELGLRCNPPVRIPAYPAEHFYALTGSIDDLNDQIPCIRDYDAQTYAREYNGGFLVGWFELEARPAFEQSTVPRDWRNYLQKDPERLCMSI